MTVVFDAEPLLAFLFDEPGAEAVEEWLDCVYDGERDGYVTTANLAELRYIAIRKTSVSQTDTHIESLREMGLAEYSIDGLWRPVSELKATYSTSLGDAYAIAAARDIESDGVTLLVGADDDYDVFEDDADGHRIERFRDTPA